MPIISQIGRKHRRVRLLLALIYLALVVGAITMLFPFMLMVAGSTKSGVDAREFTVLPRFLFDDKELYRKHIEALFNERIELMRSAYDTDAISFARISPPEDVNDALLVEWQHFLESEEYPGYGDALGYLRAPVSRTLPMMLRRLKRRMQDRFEGRIGQLNRAMGTGFVNWNAFDSHPTNLLPRHGHRRHDPFGEALSTYRHEQAPGYRYPFMVRGFFKTLFLKTQYSRDIDVYNKAHDTAYASYNDVRLTRSPPDGTAQEKVDWEEFVRLSLNLLWVRVTPDAAPTYRSFLEAKYTSLSALNRAYGTGYAAFEEVPLVTEPPAGGLVLSDWEGFVSGWRDPETGRVYRPQPEQLRIHGVEFMFSDYLRTRYGTRNALNAALGTTYRSFDDVSPPIQEAHYRAFQKDARAIRWEFATRNYKTVLDYMLIHGRGILNTAIYCALAVLAALLVNPLAAYAMSRYRPPSTYKLLLFMLITMAFPPMVTQIPVFLMLRDFELLNTFAALVLPGLAHGYSIFLLKGFFDSLPRELFECAQLDGAGEWTMFWRITMSLSKPILAVIALHAFTTAYANFMSALLICQDERMWTLMVWLYQLQQRSGPGVVYASLIVAALPTLLVFAFCQNVIMRGIVVPVEK